MMRRWRIEAKLLGLNFLLVSGGVALGILALAAAAGDQIDFAAVAFEVGFPLFAAIAAGEWGKTRADANFCAIAAQSRALLPWVAGRYAAAFVPTMALAGLCMAGAGWLRPGEIAADWIWACLSTSFFSASLSAWIGVRCAQEHAAALACGLLWLAALLARGLLRLPGVECVYPFLRFAGDPNGIWLRNKAALAAAGALLWASIAWRCRPRRRR